MLNYIGPNDTDGEGIRIYYNGKEERCDTIKHAAPYSTDDGRIVVGRYWVDRDERYSSVQVDELIYFNEPLTDTDVQSIYNSA